MHHDERIHPTPMGRGDEEIAAGRDVLLAGRGDPEAEESETQEADEQPGPAI
jgi:hypothetical protein